MLSAGIVKMAIIECGKSTFKTKVSAVVFNKKRILSSGHNGIRHSPLHKKYIKYDTSVHAEQRALIGLDWKKLSKCEMLIMRLNKSGEFRLARPCEMCLQLIKHVKIKNIYYTTPHGIVKEKIY